MSERGGERKPDMEYSVETYSFGETFEFGKKLGREARAGSVYALIGELGAGKTVLAQGIAEGLGIKEPVNSPTFTILQIYEGGRLPLYHFDVYRIGDSSEMYDIDYEEYFYSDGLCLVEWADITEALMPEEYTRITIKKNAEKGLDYRNITVKDAL